MHSYDHSAWITSRFEAEEVSFSEVSAEQNDEAFMKDVLPIVSGYGLPVCCFITTLSPLLVSNLILLRLLAALKVRPQNVVG